MTKMNNIIFMQIRKKTFLRDIIAQSRSRWGVNLEKPIPNPYKKYEDRIVEPIIKTRQNHKVNKKYEQYIVKKFPSKPIKKYEQIGDDWDIEYIKKNGGL